MHPYITRSWSQTVKTNGKFMVDAMSPDGPITKEDIESAMRWLYNHDGVVIRGIWEVKEIE